MGFLVDTCVWIDVERGALSAADVATFTRDEPVFLSPVTIAELRFGAEFCPDANIRQKRLATLRRLQRKPLLVITGTTGDIFGTLAAVIKHSGKQHRYRVQDLWMSSQAIEHNFRLLTRNKNDFDDIPGLDLVLYRLSKVN